MAVRQLKYKAWAYPCLFFVLMLFFLSAPVKAVNIDSLWRELKKGNDQQKMCDALNEAAYQLMYENPIHAYKLLEEIEKTATDIGYRKGIYTARQYRANTAIRLGDFEVAETVYDQLILTYEKEKNESELCKVLVDRSSLHRKKGEYKKALERLLVCLEYAETQKDSSYIAVIYYNMGVINSAMNSYGKALELYRKVLSYIPGRETESSGILLSAYEQMGVCYTYLHQADTAMQYFGLAEKEILTEMPGKRKSDLANLYQNMSNLFIEVDDYAKAPGYIRRALQLFDEIGDVDGVIVSYISLAAVHFNKAELSTGIHKTSELHKSRYLLDSAQLMATKIGSRPLQSEIYSRKSDVYKSLGIYDSAYINLVRHMNLQDSLNSVEKETKLRELSIKYETEKKEKEIAQLEKQNTDISMVSQRRKTLNVMVSAVVLIFLIVIVFLVYNNKIKKKQLKTEFAKTSIELEHKALRAQMNPHFLFNSLNSIQRMFVEGKTDAANEVMADFSSLLRRILNNSGKNRISLKEELDTLKLYLDIEKIRCDDCFDYEITLDESVDKMNTQVPPLIIQPFVENAIWHGVLPKKSKGKIEIRLSKASSGDFITCIVEDNGVGMDKNNARSSESKGILITEQRLGTNVIFEEPDHGGTRVILQIPFT